MSTFDVVEIWCGDLDKNGGHFYAVLCRDELDDLANDVDKICCGLNNEHCAG